jgi:hypothetical protein
MSTREFQNLSMGGHRRAKRQGAILNFQPIATIATLGQSLDQRVKPADGWLNALAP